MFYLVETIGRLRDDHEWVERIKLQKLRASGIPDGLSPRVVIESDPELRPIISCADGLHKAIKRTHPILDLFARDGVARNTFVGVLNLVHGRFDSDSVV